MIQILAFQSVWRHSERTTVACVYSLSSCKKFLSILKTKIILCDQIHEVFSQPKTATSLCFGFFIGTHSNQILRFQKKNISWRKQTFFFMVAQNKVWNNTLIQKRLVFTQFPYTDSCCFQYRVSIHLHLQQNNELILWDINTS